jgi:LuxR family maltose regulon positive regulatory protein
MADALASAKSEGYVRSFTDGGAPVAELLRAARRAGIEDDYSARLLTALGRRSAVWGEARSAGEGDLVTQALIEPLTARERDVLAAVASGLSNHETARDLGVSVNTIKTHLKHINQKLGVHGRKAAAARAKELGILV